MSTARWIDTAEVAKMIRTQLKITFPGQKFSVRIDRYSGGSAVRVGWTDGPTDNEVRKVTDGFRGGRFDGMIDLAYSADSWFCPTHGAEMARTYGHSYNADDSGYGVGNAIGASRCCCEAELVHMGSSYVSATRTLSDAFRAELQAQVAKTYDQPYDDTVMVHGEWMSTYVHRLQVTTSRYVAPKARVRAKA